MMETLLTQLVASSPSLFAVCFIVWVNAKLMSGALTSLTKAIHQLGQDIKDAARD